MKITEKHWLMKDSSKHTEVINVQLLNYLKDT